MEGDSDREEKKQKQLKKAKMAKDCKSRKEPMEVKKGKDPNALKLSWLWPAWGPGDPGRRPLATSCKELTHWKRL